MELPEPLVKDSTLTKTQIESLSAYLQVRSHEKTLKQAAEARSSGPVKIGSYYRTVQQGRRNVRAAILTLTIALWLGLVDSNGLIRLLDQLRKGLPDLDEAERNRMATVIEALASKIVM